MFGCFVVFFGCLSFLRYRFSGGFSRCFMVLFSGLGFLCGGRFCSGFVVFFRSLGFLRGGRFYSRFLVLFRRLSFLLCSGFSGGFMVFLVMGGFGSGAVSGSSRSRSGACRISSESNRRQTHSSGNDQS
ncbi:hypothetical protein EDF73_111185 [Raoultella sp. BIGb0138]|nr:hypothetical protein EDF73_111185 [Raoultella sp. BIGb0138]